MKRLLLLALAVAFAACSPDIPSEPDISSKYVVAEFDPANDVIPVPNDLLFLDASGHPDVRLHAPETGGSDAQNEFYRDYLNLLDGFPMEFPASVLMSQPIDLTSVQVVADPQAGGNLAVFDITNTQAPFPVTALNITTADAANGAQTLNIAPTSGFWTRGHRYSIIILGGTKGIKGKQSGQTVTGSPIWALVASPTPLVTNCDANGNNCKLGTSAIPTTEKDPQAQYDQQVAQAKQLEALRTNYYAPIIGAITTLVPSVKATDIAIIWTFTITSAAEVTFDPANSIIPFPNDILNPTGKQVTVPVPPDAGLITQLYTGLNTLDGFSTTAPILSENGLTTGPLVQGKLPGTPYTLGVTSPINMVAQPGSSTGADAGIPLNAFACVNCTVSPTLIDGGAKPETLEIVPRLPLNERTRYAAYITTDLTDNTGKNVIPSPAFALARSSAKLYDNGKSTVSLLTDAQAQQLEQLRAAMEPLFNGLNDQGLPRKKIALAWAFTTQSTISTLSQLHAAPTVASVPAAPLWIADTTTVTGPALDAQGIPRTAIAAFWNGEILDMYGLKTGHFTPGLADAEARPMPFVMTIPMGTAPANGWPVTIFGHGLTGNKTNVYAIANTLASIGQVAIAIDEPWHGDRNTCIGYGNYLNVATSQTIFTDAFACSNPNTQACNAAGRCQLKDRTVEAACTFGTATADLTCLAVGQGACAPDNKCEGTGAGFASGVTVAPGVTIPVSGWNFLNLFDFFATRDNIRQQTISNAQLARVIAATGPGGFNTTPPSTAVKIDPTKISYLGQSLGSFLGAVYTSVAPEVGNTVLNVAGSDLILNLFTSPSFTSQKSALIKGLTGLGIPENSPLFDQLVGTAKWILDPADAQNASYYLTHSAKLPAPLPPNINPATRRAFIQWILDDQTVVNAGTVELVNAGIGVLAADPTRISASPFWSYQFNGSDVSGVPTCDRHPFLLVPSDGVCTSPAGTPTAAGVALTTKGQGQVATFLSGGAPF